MFLEHPSPVFHHVIKDIGHRIVESTGEKRSTSYLMPTIGMDIQRGNSSSRKLDEVYYLYITQFSTLRLINFVP